MIMRKDAWHYRLVHSVMGSDYFEKPAWDTIRLESTRIPRNITLCKYFWTTVLCCQVYPFWVLKQHWPHIKGPNIPWPSKPDWEDRTWALIGLGALGCVVGLGIWFNWVFTVVLIFLIGGVVGFMFGLTMVAERIADRAFEMRRKKKAATRATVNSFQYKPPNMTWEMIKAWKAKVCPLIDFRENH